jgi:hypothetical protein
MPEYRDSETLRLAKEINDFVRSKTTNPTVASVALEVARVSFSLVEWPVREIEDPSPVWPFSSTPNP